MYPIVFRIRGRLNVTAKQRYVEETTNRSFASYLGVMLILYFHSYLQPLWLLVLGRTSTRLAPARDGRVVGWVCCSALGLLHSASILPFIISKTIVNAKLNTVGSST